MCFELNRTTHTHTSTQMTLFSIKAPPAWAKPIDVGMRYFILNVVMWIIGRFGLGTTSLTVQQMLVMAFGSVAVMFVYYLVIKRFIIDLPPNGHRRTAQQIDIGLNEVV